MQKSGTKGVDDGLARENEQAVAPEWEKFSVSLFLLTVGLTLVVLLVLLRVLAPATWNLQLGAPWFRFVGAFVVISLLICFAEFFFHRYVLHRPAIPGLGRFYRQHTLHHALTRITRKSIAGAREFLVVENRFPILESAQGEASFFPWYALTLFAVTMTPLLMVLHWALPAWPWFFAGFAAVTSSLALYEILHALCHWPLQRWLPLLEHPTWGAFWRRVYAFHLRHHAVTDCNESVSGFFGLPLADWVLGTYVVPDSIYADGEEWKRENFFAPKPCSLVQWLDRKMERQVQRRRLERNAAIPPAASISRHWSSREEIANWVTHGTGALLSAVALTLLIALARDRGDNWHLVSFTIFGLSLVALYAMSTLYHLAWNERTRGLFRRLDHAAIFVLIAGTYTPFLLTMLRGSLGWTLFGVIWLLCGTGAVLQYFFAGRYRLVSTLGYLLAGWLILTALNPLLKEVPQAGVWLLFGGGLLYTVGVPFYLWRRLRYHHAIWHGFVLGGSTCHFFAVLKCLNAGT